MRTRLRTALLTAISFSWIPTIGSADELILPAAPNSGSALTGYSASTGEVWIDDWHCSGEKRDSPNAASFDSYSLQSASSSFTNLENAQGLEGIFDKALAGKIFKLNPRGFGNVVSFGQILDPGLTEDFLLNDLTASASGLACDGGESIRVLNMGLSYFPTPNLVHNNATENTVNVKYRAITGDLTVTATSSSVIPWFGVYSAGGNINSTSPTPREIDSRIQYALDIAPNASASMSLTPRLSLNAIASDLSAGASTETHQPSIREFNFSYIAVGDVNEDTMIDALDIDLLTDRLLANDTSASFDLDANGQFDSADRDYWISDVAHTFSGDANLDGEFDSADLTQIFTAAEYRDDIVGNSTWAEGDWNGDKEFDSGDLVAAFKVGAYNKGPRLAGQDVPEPNVLILLIITAIGFATNSRRSLHRSTREA
jgi:hypothetical protein